ncbi:MAG: PBP1A family penicillin-binding protein, partial [Alphaproteobacteria bacterium]|nr:PBP1A family penicillin-binding protein [Alphaproteobacteria bacterium]
GSLVARYGGMKGSAVSLPGLPNYVPGAVVAIEDRRFYSHFGIDPIGLARAMWVNVKARRWVQGGSTITQQLAKNLFLTPDKTIRRKVQEALLALYIDYKFTKDDILAAYLNRVYYGSGAYGIDAAAQVYFGVSAKNLTVWESAILAGLLKAPSRYSPSSSPEKAQARALTVIRVMRDTGHLDADAAAAITKKPAIRLAGAETGGLNRYFSDWVINRLDDYVTASGGDITVKTTFDPALQILAEEKYAAVFADMPEDRRAEQGALVTLAKDGAVLAMIGGRDYTKSQFNRATQAQRQPGSAFKPFVFLAALEASFHPRDKILDAPFTKGQYRPENYAGKYHDVVTLTDALALSLNTATIRLLEHTGIAPLLDVAGRAGIASDIRPELAAGLGVSEVNLLELTNAYAVFSNGGHAIWPYAITEIEDAAGNIIYSRGTGIYPQLFSAYDLQKLDGMLQQVVARGTGQAAQLRKGHVVGKTGTSQDYRDAWFIGYTDKLVTGIWMGNDDNSPMPHITGGSYPARLWHDYMGAAIDTYHGPTSGFGSGMHDDAGAAFMRLLGGLSSAQGRETPVYNR